VYGDKAAWRKAGKKDGEGYTEVHLFLHMYYKTKI
jgi:hypothetical protein